MCKIGEQNNEKPLKFGGIDQNIKIIVLKAFKNELFIDLKMIDNKQTN